MTPDLFPELISLALRVPGRDDGPGTSLVIANLTNATTGSIAEGTATIADDDAAPTISINDVTVAEGASGHCFETSDRFRRASIGRRRAPRHG